MNIQSLREKYPELSDYVKGHGYSKRFIDSLEWQIQTILLKVDIGEWTSFNDVRSWHKGRLTRRTSWLSYYLTQLGIIERFTLYGEFPEDRTPTALNQNNAQVIGKYKYLVPEFRAVVDTYRKNEEERGAMKATSISRYAANAASFLYQLQCAGISTLQEITQDSIIAIFLNEDGTARRSFSYKYIISVVFKSNVESNPILFNQLISYLPNLRVNRKNIQYLSDEEMAEIKRVLFDPDSELSLRDKAIGVLALCYGLRRCDICKLRIDEIDLNGDKIQLCQQKTSAPLELPLTTSVGNAIYDYVMYERCRSSSEFVFLSEKPPYGKLSTEHYTRISNRIMKAAGIRQNVGDRKGFHIFRHRLATDLLGQDVPQPVISKIAGHISPASLEPYLSSDFVHLKDCALSIEQFPVKTEVFANA